MKQGCLVLSLSLFSSSEHLPMTSIPDYKSQDRKQLIQISVNTINTDLDHLHDSFLPQGHEEEDEELIRVVLRRNPPCLSSCFHGLRAEKQNRELDGKVRKTYSMRADDEKQSSSVVERAVRRAFSMRASSPSANEVYRRIDHQYDPVPVADHEENKVTLQTEIESSSDKKRNKVLEACRRFFGF